MTVKCQSFRSFQRNTLFGFAEILVEEIGLRIKDVTVFEKNGKRWVGLPAKPQLKDGMAVKDEAGKPQYFSILEFANREISDAFSVAVIRAVLEHAPDAFGGEPTASKKPASSGFHDDQIPF
jgi:hypothetical protein